MHKAIPDPTPGQVAYEAWFHRRYARDPLRLRPFPPFADLQTITQQSWDAAAQAVLAHVPGYTVEYDENSCAWLIEQATRLRMALSHGMTLRIEQITLPAYQQQETQP